MMKGLMLLLVCYYLLILAPRGEATQHAGECPSLSADHLARLKKLVAKEDAHHKITGSLQDLWGAKEFYDADPNTCVRHSKRFINDTVLSVKVKATGKWFNGTHRRNSYLVKVDNNVYLEMLPNQKNGKDVVLAKAYMLYAKNGVYGFFWCLMFVPGPEMKAYRAQSVAGVSVNRVDLVKPLSSKVQESIKEAVQKIKANKDILGDIVQFKPSC